MYERKSILGRWQVPGLGPIELLSQNEIPADAVVRSCHLVETTRAGTPLEKRRYALKVQCGHEVPESKPGLEVGIDYGIRNTVTTSEGEVLQRPDTAEMEKAARELRAHAKGRCKKDSRQYHKLQEKARKLTAKVSRIHDNWEREAAKTLCLETSLIVREDLRLKNMMTSGAGTTSAPGSQAKKGLNRDMNRARIGRLDTRIERRALKTGTDTVTVHPGNTSNICPECGAKDKKSRDKTKFECTSCGHKADADKNASINIRGRGQSTFNGWRTRRELGRVGHSSRRITKEEAGTGQWTQAARGAPGQASRHARLLPRNNLGDARGPPRVVNL